MEQTILKKVRENFKKKRRYWSFDCCTVNSMDVAFNTGQQLLEELSSSFSDEEKEKYNFNNLKVCVTPNKLDYHVTITFGH